MADCNIRNIDADLMRDIKTLAAQDGLTLRQWCIKQFENARGSVHLTDPQLETLRKNLPLSEPHNPKTCRVYRCSQCIALGKSY